MAQTLAGAVVDPEGDRSPRQVITSDLASVVSTRQPEPEPAVVVEPGVEPVVQPTVPEPELAGEPAGEESVLVIDTELLDALAELGVELGVDPDSVPAELKPTYSRLVEAGMKLGEENLALAQRLYDLETQRGELRDQFENSPLNILITLALVKPQAFEQALQVYQRMTTDAEYKDMITERLAAETKLAEAERRERVLEFGQKERVRKQLENATDRAAKKFGVDRETAHKVVAAAIVANNRQAISVAEVERQVAAIGAAGATRQRQPLRHVTPAAAAAARSAPGSSLGDAGTPAVVETPEQPKRRGLQSPWRKLMGDALRKQQS